MTLNNSFSYIISKATTTDSSDVAMMVGELLEEIMNAIGNPVFRFNLEETVNRLTAFIERGKYFVFIARGNENLPLGFITLYESYALYAEGVFGTIPELYVRTASRSGSVGQALVSAAKQFASLRGWARLEVTTPPLPQFQRTLNFYEREGFAISGGRKLKVEL